MRKYEYETGRFISIDPLWGKYYGWTPYQYSMNSPVMLVDFNGKNVFVLLDKEGASGFGHQAVLIGTEYDEERKSGGYYLYSKNGGKSAVSGPSVNEENGVFFKTINVFLNDKSQDRYDLAIRINTSKSEDTEMKSVLKKQVIDEYKLFSNSCNNTAICAANKVNTSKKELIFQPGRSVIPNVSFQQLYYWNKENERISEPIDLNEWRDLIK